MVGDENYGEGSSREHAAMSPRLLGGAAVIVRSFARIHESNLKKQGVLPLTFANPADYDKVRETRPRQRHRARRARARASRVRVILHHADGSEERVRARATRSTAEQIAWFRAGSALNVLRQVVDPRPQAKLARPKASEFSAAPLRGGSSSTS